MNSIKVFVETGKKKVFVGAVDWPGWCRSSRDEESALQTLIDYGPRYGQVLEGQGTDFPPPSDPADLAVIERHEGNSTTDFGAPAIMLDVDREPLDRNDFERSERLLGACWETFDRSVEQAAGQELRKGPRGGGRDLEKIINHVIEADRAYLARLARKHKRETGFDLSEELGRTRGAILDALAVAAAGDLPEKGSRGGAIWPVRFFIRRVAWHVLDHAWEIEDRIE